MSNNNNQWINVCIWMKEDEKKKNFVQSVSGLPFVKRKSFISFWCTRHIQPLHVWFSFGVHIRFKFVAAYEWRWKTASACVCNCYSYVAYLCLRAYSVRSMVCMCIFMLLFVFIFVSSEERKKKCIQGSQQLINLPCAICLSVCGCMAFWFFNDFALYKWILRGSVLVLFFSLIFCTCLFRIFEFIYVDFSLHLLSFAVIWSRILFIPSIIRSELEC